jgi:predicted O-methyltransferase YrrM
VFVAELWRWFASFFKRQSVVRRSSAHHPHLEVAQIKGRKVLDGATVNYSYGGLQAVFAEAFERLSIRDREVHAALVLGLGAGGVVRLLREDHAIKAPITAVEIDPVMVDIAKLHFGLGRFANLDVVVDDAVRWVERATRRFDLVVVDVFIEARIPESLRTSGFLRNLRDRMTPGALLVFNVVADRPSARAEALQFAHVFDETLGKHRPIEVRGNLVLAWERPRAESAVADRPPAR